ncbi:MAG: hypothetical protein H6624_08230 [Bdellovibrionaceae bacterium]|nr:hypothetical protein [Bdellovibrionales bacterium]MCB9084319.1 hypothetical protein [Pseudobdellovibrionaceae bacterium]
MKTSAVNYRVIFVWSLFAALMVSMAMMTTACGKKDGKKSAATPGANRYDPNCPNCNIDGTLLGAALGFNGGTSSSAYRMQIGMNLVGSAGTTGGSWGYNGPVSATGVMFVNSSDQYCPMPIGGYTLTTYQAGQWDGGSGMFQNLGIDAHHGDGTILHMRIIYGIVDDVQPNLIDAEGFSYPYGFIGDVVVESVNNVPCVQGFPGLPPLNQFFFSY